MGEVDAVVKVGVGQSVTWGENDAGENNTIEFKNVATIGIAVPNPSPIQISLMRETTVMVKKIW